jgi:hypothetical protein
LSSKRSGSTLHPAAATPISTTPSAHIHERSGADINDMAYSLLRKPKLAS